MATVIDEPYDLDEDFHLMQEEGDILPAEPLQIARGPMQEWAWLNTCVTAFGANRAVRRFVVDRDDQGLAWAVLTRPKHAWLEAWRMPGVDELREPMDFAYQSLGALEELATQMIRQGVALRLARIRADSPTIAVLKKAVGRFGKVVVRPQPTYPYIELDDSWRSPVDKLNSRRRSDFRRSLKRAEEFGEVRTEVIAPKEHELDRLLDLAFDIEARSWKGEAGTALARDTVRANFFRRYAHQVCQQGILRFNYLHIGDAVAAMQIAVEQDGALWLLKVGYDAEFARCSPGSLLIADTIKYAADKKLKSYEFLGVSESWTRVWTEQERDTVSVRVYPLSLGGAGALLRDSADTLWRRCQRKNS